MSFVAEPESGLVEWDSDSCVAERELNPVKPWHLSGDKFR